MKDYSATILTTDVLHTSVTRIYDIIHANLATDPFIVKIAPLLKKWITELSKTLARTRKSEKVKILKQKDKKRDGLFLGLRDYVKSGVNDADPAIAEAASYLLDVFHELGWTMYSLGYSTESSKLKALIEKLESEPGKTHVTTISATSRLANLKAAQTDFETTFNQKVDDKSAQEYLQIRECRKHVYRYVMAMLSYIDAMDEMEGAAYHTAAIKIDEVITESISIAKARQTRHEDDEDETEAGTKDGSVK